LGWLAGRFSRQEGTTMQSLASLRTAAILKALREQGLTNQDIIELHKEGGLQGLAVLAGK
jgi:hypothetical protein